MQVESEKVETRMIEPINLTSAQRSIQAATYQEATGGKP